MLRKIIKIDEEKCSGCGACAAACHEGAIAMVDGKAKLVREDYCDGLGDCLPACPTDAISFEEREAPAYNASESETDVVLPPVFTTVTVSEELTSEDIETLGERTICVTAYAVQTHSLTEKDAIALAVTQFLPDNTPADTPIIE